MSITDISERLCARCEATLTRTVRLGSLDGPGTLLGEPKSVVADRISNYYVVQYTAQNYLSVFDSAGRPKLPIGRRGAGPGEFLRIHSALILDDTLFVFDPGTRLVTALTSAGTVARTIPFPYPSAFQVVRIAPRLLVVGSSVPTRDLAGLPLHTYDVDKGGYGNSFGDSQPVVRPLALPYLQMRAVSAAGAGRVWSAKHNAYEIERWTATGVREIVLRRRVDWFAPYLRKEINTDEPPPPWLMSIHALNDSLVVTFITLPGENYKRVLGPKVTINGRETYDKSRVKQLYDTLIEVIDVKTATVVYRKRVDDYLIGFIPGTSKVFAADNVDGVPFIDVYSFVFSPTSIQSGRLQ